MAADPQYIANVEGGLPRIMIARGDWLSEDVVTRCTGCGEETTFSWRQWKGDFTGNISDFEQFMQWAKWHAARHECFLAGRVGYLAEPPERKSRERLELEAETTWPKPLAEHEREFEAAQVERHEDPWGGVGYVGSPEDDFDRFLNEEDDPYEFESDCLTCGAHSWTFVDGDCPKCNPPIEDEGYWPVEPCMSHEECDMEPCIYAGEKLEYEPKFETVTGRINRPLPIGILEIETIPPDDVEFDVFDVFYIEFDYADLEQQIFDEAMVDVGLYTRDAAGHLRDEKGRCLACLRPGVHR